MTRQRSLKIALAVSWALLVLLLAGFGLKLLNDLVLTPQQGVAPRLTPSPAKREERAITIYFADEGASKLVPERRFAKLGAGTSADAKAIMAELIRGPQSPGLLPTVPADTRLLNAYEIGDMLVLDFTHELQTNHMGGSTSELLTVYSIVNTMTQNMNGIRKIQMLVEGEEIETLAGHLDLTKPLFPNLKWLAT